MTHLAKSPDYQAALAYSQARQGLTLLVAHQDQVYFCHYAASIQPEQPLPIASGTKSFAGVLGVLAIQAGLITWDEPVSQTFPEWQDPPARQQITIRQLLNLTCGLAPGRSTLRSGEIPTTATALTLRQAFPAGQRFHYSSGPFQIFTALLARKLAAVGLPGDPLIYLKKELFMPMGLEIGGWSYGTDGLPHLASGARLTAHNWLKFGQLLAAGGQWQGQRLLDLTLLQDCWQGSVTNPAYGLGFWLNPKTGGLNAWGKPFPPIPAAPSSLVMALGAGNQNLYVWPEQGWVIVRQGQLNRQDILATPLFEHQEFLEQLQLNQLLLDQPE
jgi:CubicO group peptidase (beta-lactamase class C family)